MKLRTVQKKNTLIVAARADGFARVVRASRVAESTRLTIIPLLCEDEILQALQSSGATKATHAKNILLIIDPRNKLSRSQEQLIHQVLSLGADWCSLKIYEGLMRGHAKISSLKDALEWIHWQEQTLFTVLKEAVVTVIRRCAALLLGLLLLPLLMIIAVAIKCTSSGPVLYRQPRLGHCGRPFSLLKFRTMHVDAERHGPQWCQGDSDPRTYPLGRFLRKSHLDELPQLWNVLRGDLCFVGPRPERPEFCHSLKEQIPHFNLRTRVRPGMTGWAQLRAGYASSVADSRIKVAHDVFYMRSSGAALIAQILYATAKKCCGEIFRSLILMAASSKLKRIQP
jgi:lipopolysaccharide/colanic/teichoic acid biosynthesis glycosyltransferase